MYTSQPPEGWGNIVICDSVDRPYRNYVKWNESDRGKKNTLWFHSYVESKQ